MLMDLFYAQLPVHVSKRRVHFHNFMLEVHQRIWAYKQSLLAQFGRERHVNLSSERDAITQVAQAMSREARVLCFDEFQVTDVADAMILTKFFGVLWSSGTVLVATSNRPPSDLYKEGLNRQYFLPFLADLERFNLVKQLGGAKDYRQLNTRRAGAYFSPLNAATDARLWRAFLDHPSLPPLDHEAPVQGYCVPVMMGRTLRVSHAKPRARCCHVSFASLCEADKGASDYQALCAHFDTVYLRGVPQMSVLEHDKSRRFITLVDTLYDSHIQLVWTAETAPADMFRFLTTHDAEGKSAPLGTDHKWGDLVARQGGGDVGGWRYTTAVDHSKFGAVVSRGLAEGQGQGRADLQSQQSREESPAHVPRIVPRVDTGITSARRSVGSLSPPSGVAPVDAAQDELKLLEGELSSVQELGFAFRRAASRLTEMSSEAWPQRRL